MQCWRGQHLEVHAVSKCVPSVCTLYIPPSQDKPWTLCPHCHSVPDHSRGRLDLGDKAFLTVLIDWRAGEECTRAPRGQRQQLGSPGHHAGRCPALPLILSNSLRDLEGLKHLIHLSETLPSGGQYSQARARLSRSLLSVPATDKLKKHFCLKWNEAAHEQTVGVAAG